eukprot:COSAG06_NODE_59106_length_275_cov_0.590909_1_plen_36_part_01
MKSGALITCTWGKVLLEMPHSGFWCATLARARALLE